MRVLVVEDDPLLCDVLRDFLRELGHEPVVTHCAEDAITCMGLELPDAVLLDIYLPGISGLDFLQLQTTRESRIPIVAISGMAAESQARECVQLGAVDFLPKPVELERLREVLTCLEPHAGRPCPSAHRNERRRAPRAAVAVPVRVVENGGTEWEATSVDLSTVGVKLRSSRAVNPGRAAKLSFALPDGDGALEVSAMLVRSDGRGYAFDFVSPTDDQLGRLREFVQRGGAGPARAVEAHFRVLRAISRALSLSLDVDQMLRIALDALTRVTGHEISSLHLLSDDRRTLRLLADRGLSAELRMANRVLAVGQGVIGRVVVTGETVHVTNVAACAELPPANRAVVEREGIRRGAASACGSSSRRRDGPRGSSRGSCSSGGRSPPSAARAPSRTRCSGCSKRNVTSSTGTGSGSSPSSRRSRPCTPTRTRSDRCSSTSSRTRTRRWRSIPGRAC